jgi:ribosomal protein L11 methyltransferase
MKYEISIEGPLEELKALFFRLQGMNPSMREIPSGNDNGQPKGRIIVLEEDDPGLDSSLRDISESISRVKVNLARDPHFDLRVRNLSYSEPPSWCSSFMEAFNPIPSLTVQPWTSSMEDGAGPGTIVLDPHHAFGTGKHPTTKLCLQLMETIVTGKPREQSILDFGCGTGLLAISAAHMGARECLGVEIDFQSSKTARRNVMLNRFEDKIEIRHGSWEVVHEKFDIIFANIVTAALLRCGPHIPLHLKDKGNAVVSGFGTNQVQDMRRLFEKGGLLEVQYRELDGWAALVLENR